MTSVKVVDKNGLQPQLVRKEQYSFYSQWYHPVVRSLIDLYGFRGDFKRLAQMVTPPITPAQAKKSVALLESLGFILRQNDGNYKVVDKIITSSPEVISLAIHNYHTQIAGIAKNAINELPRNRRCFTGMTLGISASSYGLVCKELENFRNRLLELANNDTNDDDEHGVYQLNLQLFSVSQQARLQEKSGEEINTQP
jgi:uncharacterized protein (TIGR02147 family)